VDRESELYDLSIAFLDTVIEAISDVGLESERSIAMIVECIESMAE